MSTLLQEIEAEVEAEFSEAELTQLAREMIKAQKIAQRHKKKSESLRNQMKQALGPEGLHEFLEERGLETIAIINQTYTVTSWMGVAELMKSSGPVTDNKYEKIVEEFSETHERIVTRELDLAASYNAENPSVHVYIPKKGNPKMAPKLSKEQAMEVARLLMTSAVSRKDIAESFGVSVCTLSNYKKSLRAGKPIPYSTEHEG